MAVLLPRSPVTPGRYVDSPSFDLYDSYVSSVLRSSDSIPSTTATDKSQGTPQSTSESQTSARRCSSGQKLTKLINALTPCRGRMTRRSHSFESASRVQSPTIQLIRERQALACRSTTCTKGMEFCRQNSVASANLIRSNWATKLDVLSTDPCTELYEFRRRWPSSFVTLITNYLGFLTFTAEDIQQIRDSLIKEAKSSVSSELFGKVTTPQSPTARSLTPRKLHRHRELKSSDKELEHWHIVINTVLNYLLCDERYKHRFILRRPGSHASLNELERILFPPRHRPLSVSLKNRSLDQSSNDDRLQQPARPKEILDVLNKYDSSVIACLLSRVLRRQGTGLLPIHLRPIFLQLVNNTKENEAHQLRAIRLLFQLLPKRLVHSVMQPLFQLMAQIASEPECAVDETSLAVLFAPVFFLDRSTTSPAALANPMPLRAVELLVRLAKRELDAHHSVLGMFRVPVLFQEDCIQNYNSHLNLENPPLSCSLRYCANMTPSPRGKHTDQDDDKSRCQSARSAVPRINLTSTFMAKRPRQGSPYTSTEGSMPALKSALLSPPLDFRVRRAPNSALSSSQLWLESRSPFPAKSASSKWSS